MRRLAEVFDQQLRQAVGQIGPSMNGHVSVNRAGLIARRSAARPQGF
jgi:hypothetical protein